MLLKRLAAVMVALILVIQLTACGQTTPPDNTSHIDTSSVETSTNDTSPGVSEDDKPQKNDEGDTQTDNSSVNSNQNDSSEETPSGDASSSENIDASKPDNNKVETNTDNTATGCNHSADDPYQNINKSEFYANYTPACCNLDATYRTKHYLLSGSLEVPGQYAVEADSRPQNNRKFIRNTATMYIDGGNTYIVMDSNGAEVMRIHKAGGYITLEEVAAYMYAFGGSGKIPANYSSKKSTKPGSSPWGEYLRVNHSYFKGDTNKYPYEPELPNISGCGGSLQYYEMDIGTTGTATPGYAAKPYIQGNKVNRGAARIVYARQDLNGNGEYEQDEVYVFYTHNHYNDFREYLNYYGGWGEMFGNVTGGGEYSSETNANPTPYVTTDYDDFSQ